MQPLAPFRLRPHFQTRIWGFQDLAPWFDFKTDGEPVGEVWLNGAQCTIETGELAGQRFGDALSEQAPAILGAEHTPAEGKPEFPLLLKVLFPREKLSVQVHPDDAMAVEMGEPRGKTECWYALEAEPGAKVAVGLQPGATPDAVRTAIEEHRLEDLLGWLPMSAGDMVYVDAGTVHAIWPGAVILETQQTSDTTYRLYDYGRPRELHVDNSLRAMRVQTAAGKVEPFEDGGATVLIDQKYFRVERWKIDGEAAAVRLGSSCYPASAQVGSPALLFVGAGALRIRPEGEEPMTLGRGDLVVLPAYSKPYQIEPVETAEIFRILPK